VAGASFEIQQNARLLPPFKNRRLVKITQKFFLFGLIPALAQAFISVQMFSLLNSVEFFAAKEARQSTIDRKLTAAMAEMINLAVAAKAFAAVPGAETARMVEASSARTDAIFAELRGLTKDDPASRADIERLISIGSTARDQFIADKRATDQNLFGGQTPVFDIESVASGRMFVSCLKQTSKILDRQSAQLDETRARLKEDRQRVKFLVWAELFFSSAVIGVLYLLFRYDFGRRFGNLLENARMLALDRRPSKEISGGDELSELSKALIVAAEQRQEAVTQKQSLFQMVTHDLRSPLMASSIVVTTMIDEEAETREERRKRLGTIDRNLQRVIDLANDLLTIEKLSAGGLELHRVNVDFQETIEQAVETVQPLADLKNCRIANLSPSLLVSIDEDRVLQVTVNLLANAIKFSPAGALVEVKASLEEHWLRVEVLDRGPGIDPKDVQKLFDPFRQGAARQGGGFGLGLAIAKLLVDLHGGNIGASARPGGGTIFWYTLKPQTVPIKEST
jgi:signal transduction histidine kinase